MIKAVQTEFGPRLKLFSGLPATADRLKIFTLNREDRLSTAEQLGLGLNALICTLD